MDACRRFPLILVAVVALLSPAPPSPVGADPRDDKKRADAATARASTILEGATARARAAARRLDAVSAALPGAQQQVADTRGQVAAAMVAANTARRAADRAQAVVDSAAQRYVTSAQQVVEARERVASFVAAAYKGGDIVTINVLLGARSPQDVTQRAGYVERVLTAEQASVGELVVARGAAKQAELDAELARREAEAARREAESTLGAAQAAQQRAQEAADALAALHDERGRALAVARRERAASLVRYRRARAEAARVAAELRAWQSRRWGRGPVLRPGARFLMPVHGWKSSEFGMRYDPFFRVWQMHDGIDLAADGGQPIFAAADGEVIRASYYGGYGNFTCISHGRYRGRGVSTCYAHQSAIFVQAGQWVGQGDVIGRVGSTGASTGYHLHFEVRLDGTPTQPLHWLPGCLC